MPKQPSPQQSSGGSSRKKTQKEPDALELLKADHDNVISLFRQHASASVGDQASLAKQIFHELEIHTAVEEELFYPALREQGDLKEIAELEGDDRAALGVEDASEDADEDEAMESDQDMEEEDDNIITLAYEDHKAVKELIQELKSLDPSTDQYRDRFLELEESVTDHVGEEEEVLFPQARLKVDRKKLGAEIVKRRSDLASSMAA